MRVFLFILTLLAATICSAQRLPAYNLPVSKENYSRFGPTPEQEKARKKYQDSVKKRSADTSSIKPNSVEHAIYKGKGKIEFTQPIYKGKPVNFNDQNFSINKS